MDVGNGSKRNLGLFGLREGQLKAEQRRDRRSESGPAPAVRIRSADGIYGSEESEGCFGGSLEPDATLPAKSPQQQEPIWEITGSPKPSRNGSRAIPASSSDVPKTILTPKKGGTEGRNGRRKVNCAMFLYARKMASLSLRTSSAKERDILAC